jgi:nucleotide-binding universal stress UspA family protein
MDMDVMERVEEKSILVAVDDTESGKRALLYVADMLGGMPGFRATILHIVPEPPEDYFAGEGQREEWRAEREKKGALMVEQYRNVMVQSGFGEDKVETEVIVKACRSLAECIFEEVERLGACTVVVGRRGISSREEFLFGSTSHKLLRTAKHCAVWIVE